eukprot:TRINITY_DN6859_c0_g1_i2.p1 TRINITY_DN6859_c0_g1~~TRINITY_DN6859_c0_g1_i2.p1  ORF type:complete len:376 (-),score=72.14 TRINITY_DN6859_c0_g1_i2:294-1421(-)
MSVPAPPSGPVKKQNRNPSKPQQYDKTVLFLASQYFPYAEWLGKRSKSIYTVLLCSLDVEKTMDFGSKRAFNVIQSFDNYQNNNRVEFQALQLHAITPFDHIVCLSEEDMIRTAHLRSKMGIEIGADVATTERFRDKVLMKTMVDEEINLIVPRFSPVDCPMDLIRYIDQNGYPVVIKPKQGYGSVNTSVIRDEEKLLQVLDELVEQVDSPLEMIVESFISGQMYHVDGYMYQNEVKMIWPSAYVNTVVDFETNNFIAGYSLHKSNPLVIRIQENVRDTLYCLQGDIFYPFHAEVWVTPEDEIVFCEVAARTGGGGIPVQMLELFAVNLSKTYMQYQCGEEMTLNTLDIPYEQREAANPNCVAWLFVYPKIVTFA